jgi:hypothetical protein
MADLVAALSGHGHGGHGDRAGDPKVWMRKVA